MDRVIKFRGKSKRTEEWIYGDLIQDLTANRFAIVPQETGGFNYYDYEIIPETRGQYIGRSDENGAEIYDGDIGKRTINRFGFNDYWLIEWLDKTAGFTTTRIAEETNGKYNLIKPRKQNSYSTRFGEIEIIGNTTDNKELLEGK